MIQSFLPEITAEPRHWPVCLREYHRDRTCDSNSTISLFLNDRWGYYLSRVLGTPSEPPSHEKAVGSAFHVFLQEPDKFDDEVLVLPSGTTRRSKAGEHAAIDHPDKAVIEENDLYRLERMKSAVLNNQACAELLEDGDWDTEHAVRMIHPESGLPIKVCFDGLHGNGRIRDIKTAANPRLVGYKNFRESMWDYGYYRQAALYSTVRDAYRPFFNIGQPEDDETGFDWIVVGTDEPFEAYRYQCGAATLELGRMHVNAILNVLAACKLFAGDTDDAGPWRDPNHGRIVTVDLKDFCFNKELSL